MVGLWLVFGVTGRPQALVAVRALWLRRGVGEDGCPHLPLNVLGGASSNATPRAHDGDRRLADDREYRLALAAPAEKIAERYHLTILREEIPDAWLFDPKTVSYLPGVGAAGGAHSILYPAEAIG